MNAKGIEQTEMLVADVIRMYAEANGITELEAATRYFTENPRAYALWNNAQKSRHRLGLAASQREAQEQPKPERTAAEVEIERKAAALQRQEPGLSRLEAVSRVCRNDRALYAAYDKAERRRMAGY